MTELGLTRVLAWHLGYENDDGYYHAHTPEQLWEHTYQWVCKQIA